MVAAAMEETRQRDMAMQQTLENDIQTIEDANAQINQANDRVLPRPGDADRPESRRGARAVAEMVDRPARIRLPIEPIGEQAHVHRHRGHTGHYLDPAVRIVRHHSACFAAGTLVQTIDGPRPIESIQVGDRVLVAGHIDRIAGVSARGGHSSQRPAATLRIAIGGESIVATGIHRFWKAGKGWTMARDLKAGDRLRMVGGMVEIQSIEADATQMVYNLDVAENRDFFVGKKGLLVHDFSFVQPVLSPFDRQPDLASPTPN